MAILSAAVGAVSFGSRSWGALLLAVPMSALGCVFVLSFLDDPVFGDAVLHELGWSWFASNLAASLMPVATVVVTFVLCKRRRRDAAGFEVIQSGREVRG